MNFFRTRKKVYLTNVFAYSCDHVFFNLNNSKRFGTYGAVTRKKQKQREKYYEEKYKHNPSLIPKYSKVKKGSRGGWINNPLKEVTKNSGSNTMYEKKIKEEINEHEKKCIDALIRIRKEMEINGNINNSSNDMNIYGGYTNSAYNNNKITWAMDNKNDVSHSYGRERKNKQDLKEFDKSKPNNFDIFSICDSFIDKKKEIINKIENPEHFVDKHIKSLINEYNNINNLHENCNANNYPNIRDYIKETGKEKIERKNNKKKRNNFINSLSEKNLNETGKLYGISNGEESYKTCDNNVLEEENGVKVYEETSGNILTYDEPKYDNLQNTHDENTTKKLYIEDILNYIDENEFDIGYLDVFTMLSTIDRNKKLSFFFKNIESASFILYNNCIIPSKFSEGTLHEYLHTRNKCSLFDKSYQLIIKLYGNDCFYICNQFISNDLNDMNKNDVCYTCILDNKSYILDIGYVLKGDNEIVLITSGFYKKGVYEFLSDYILFCKDSGMDINIEADMNKRVLSIQGPISNIVFNDVMEYFDLHNQEESKLYLKNVMNDINIYANESVENNSQRLGISDTDSDNIANNSENNCIHGLYFNRKGNESNFFNIPYMSFEKINIVKEIKKNNNIFNSRENSTNMITEKCENKDELNKYEILCIRIGDTGEDGYEFVVDNNISDKFVKLFLNHKNVKLAGAYALDILRMEAGFPLYGVDIFKNTTPITASLAWTLKYKKIKERSVFGYENILKEYSMKSKFLRVGIICKKLIFKTCKILSYPYKEPIGYITSCTWSPVYKMRIAQGYIKREFAKNNEKILISIPIAIPEHFSKKKKYKILRSRSSHIFVLAQVCAFPFVEHKYGI
ncbi:aminomethyltransferase, putative [Plasmodium berghei]|uniref:Aminomethyltransferase, putative n=1 Tax=Plasmodium berghei TaxID=5821 RepID=A0A0Y9ZYW9_PLABE|nr:aminomethyltransferase, putative [Plasmodium berghei]